MDNQPPETPHRKISRRDFLKLGGGISISVVLAAVFSRLRQPPPEISSLSGSSELAQPDSLIKLLSEQGIDTSQAVGFRFSANNIKGQTQADFLILPATPKNSSASPRVFTTYQGKATELSLARRDSYGDTVFSFSSSATDEAPAFVYVVGANGNVSQMNFFPPTSGMQSLFGKDIDWNQTPGAPILPEKIPNQLKNILPGVSKPVQIAK